MKKRTILILLILACSLPLLGCGKEKTIEEQEKINEISNKKEIPDNLIIITDKKHTNSNNDNVRNIEDIDKDKEKDSEKKPEPSIPKEEPLIPEKPIDEIEVVASPSKIRFYENLIKDDEVKHEIYLNIAKAVKNREKQVLIPILKDTSYISQIYEYVKLDYPEYFYIPTKFKILTTKINNVVSAMELELAYYDDFWDMQNIPKYYKEIEIVAKEIISKVESIDGDYNKVLYIYKYLTQNITYEADSVDDYSLYGALINKKATCEGYSEAFQYLLNALNIDAITIVGNSKEQPHQWNMVKIDSLWYFFDATWDSLVNSSKYLPYNYFAITTEDIKQTHIVDNEEILPISKNKKYNYYYYNDLILYSYDEKSLLDLSKKSLALNANHISFRVENKDIYDMVIDSISEWVPKIIKILDLDVSEISYTLNVELNIIDIYIRED